MAKAGKVLLAVLLVVGLSPFALFTGAKKAYADTVSSMMATSDGTNITLVYSGTTANQWYSQDALQLTYADGESHTIYVVTSIDSNTISANVDGWMSIADSCSLSASSTSAYEATLVIPVSYFGGRSFTITANGQTVSSDALAGATGDNSGESGSSESGSGTGADSGSSTGSGDNSGNTDQGNSGSGSGSDSGSGSTSSGVDVSTLTPTTSGYIVVDGANSDWGSIDALSSTDSYVSEWKLARDTSGNVYLMFDGTASTEWDYNFTWYGFDITQNGATSTIPVTWLADQTGATVQYKNNANQNTPAPYVVEAMIPASYFTDDAATIKFVGLTVPVDEIPVIDGTDTTEEAPTTYEGIVIDGKYLDWSPVTKYDSNDENGELQQVAMVWDDDTVYLYLEETPGTLGAYHAGTHGNGKYEIITDLDQRLVFQLNSDGTVSGPEGATAQHVGNKWEIAIPASNLPNYLETISFGMYQSDPMIENVSNLNGEGSGGSFTGIVYDGLYGDWDYYPHHIIEYATAGTQEQVEDASGALYAEDGTLYGHVYTTMQQHLDNANGHEFTSGITIKFNDDTSLVFYPMMTTVDSNGNITWSPQLQGLENGTYEFYIMSTDAWHTSANIGNLDSHDTVYGKMTVTIADDKDQCEFYLDLDKIAEKLGMDASDFKTISAQFINIGDEWITTAGTSTMPFVGIGLGLGTVACVLGWRKFYDGKTAKGKADGQVAS